MYAILETGGKQYRVSVGDLIEVEKIDKSDGAVVEFDKVLMIKADEETKIGTPCVEGAKVIARIIKQRKGRKVVVFKFKRRKNYRRKIGHRQPYTRVRIEQIVA